MDPTLSKEKPHFEVLEAVSSSSDVDDFSDVDKKKVLRKVDIGILPLFSLLYLLSFIDRTNIGNAKVEGIAQDLNLVGNQFNMVLLIFGVTYSLFEIPSNMILRRVNPRIFLPATMVLWSIVMTLMGTVRNYAQLMVTRALLGVFEASLFPGMSFMLSMYYSKSEVLIRQTLFFSAASMAGAFSGLLAAGISQMDGLGGYEGWRWIFILEGLATFVVAFFAFFVFPMHPEKCSFLTPREREYVLHKVKYSSNTDGQKMGKKLDNDESQMVRADMGEDDSNSRHYVWAVFKDWQSWCMLMIYYGVCAPVAGMSIFTPIIISGFGHSNTKTQLMAVPVFIVGTIFGILQSFACSRVGLRSPFLIFNFICMAIGYTICIAFDVRTHTSAVYAALFVISLGAYPAFPVVVIWFSNNLSGAYKRAVGMAFQISFGQLATVYASNFYREKDFPQFTLGHSLELGFILVGLLFVIICLSGYSYCNAKRRKDLAAGKYDSFTDEDFRRMGDKSPHFVYRL